MTIVVLVIVSALLIALFVGVTIAGGKSHDRQNEAAEKKCATPPPAESNRPSVDRTDGPSRSVH